jgi:hypothetical protein
MLKKPKVRNHLAIHPLLKKGGAHIKPSKVKRVEDKRKLQKDLRDYGTGAL